MWNLHRSPIFVAVTAALCNVVSNVPAVMLLRDRRAGLPDPHDRLARAGDGVDACRKPDDHRIGREHHRRRACRRGGRARRLPRVLSRRPAGDNRHAGGGNPVALVRAERVRLAYFHRVRIASRSKSATASA